MNAVQLCISCWVSWAVCRPWIDRANSVLNPCSNPAPTLLSNRKLWRSSRRLSRDMAKITWPATDVTPSLITTQAHLLVRAITSTQEVWTSGFSPQRPVNSKASLQLFTAGLWSDSLGGFDQIWQFFWTRPFLHTWVRSSKNQRTRGAPVSYYGWRYHPCAKNDNEKG